MTFADISYYLNKGYQFPFPGKLLSAAPRATLTHFSCSPNFPRASVTRYTHAKHEQILHYSRDLNVCFKGDIIKKKKNDSHS